MNEDFDKKYEDLIRMMRTAPKPGAPEDFTQRVMNALPESAPAPGRTDAFLKRLISGAVFAQADQPPARHHEARESFICLVLTGVFYLVLGAVLMAGMTFMGQYPIDSPFIRLLPWFGLFTAFWFFGLAAVMIVGGERAIAGVRAGTM
ncbi:MAG: hypothetical protein JW943_00060, partial [Deltaproteobacteria bacterium]|nr:hypothetical protein [Deltaproteobacteria bacterium]